MSIEHSPQSKSNSKTDSFVDLADCFLDELTEESSRDQSLNEFYGNLIRRLGTLISFQSASLWLANNENEWTKSIRSGEQATDVGIVEQNTLTDISVANQSRILESQESILVLAPIIGNTDFKKILCCEFDHDLDLKLARVFRDLLDAVVEVANSFERQQIISQQSSKYKKLETFVQILHDSTKTLNVNELAYQVTNDCRSFVAADRTWLFSCANELKLLACSGVSEINRRSKSVINISEIAKSALTSNQNISLDINSPDAGAQFGGLLSTVQCNVMQIVLIKKQDETSGILIAEFFEECDQLSTFEGMNQIVKAIQQSFNNALYFSNLPLRGIAQMAYQLRRMAGLRSVSRIWLAITLFASLIASTFLFTCDFEIPVEGQVRPVFERHIFAPEDAMVSDLSVAYGDNIAVDQVVLSLYSKDLSLQQNELQSELSAATKKLRATKLIRSEAMQQNKESNYIDQLSADLEQTELEIKSINRKMEWLIDRMKNLEVASPIQGQVITRDIELRLLRRPVKSGDLLLTVAKTDSDWRIEFEIPDNEFGYLLDFARDEEDQEWPVEFRFSSDLNRTNESVIQSFDQNNWLDSDGKSWIRAFAPIDREKFDGLRVGQTVKGRVNCGRRSLFYVWTREIRDYFRKNFFWI